jgi:hypothetical protein
MSYQTIQTSCTVNTTIKMWDTIKIYLNLNHLLCNWFSLLSHPLNEFLHWHLIFCCLPSIEHHWLNRKLLRDLDDERHPFCLLTAVETDHGKLAMERWLGRCLPTLRAVSGETPAPAAAVTTGDPPPSNDSAWERSVPRVIDTTLGDNGS